MRWIGGDAGEVCVGRVKTNVLEAGERTAYKPVSRKGVGAQ